ncbi:unnamed protein product [Fusarium equiseti]|uniref:Protein kinase domain-containing protein n=1 Tax=Fusarium equiseti TaxID=61235 RepID=A0A8J2NBA3_FUSEQ|nr:unnamed protein product [Fusarium equiseti]
MEDGAPSVQSMLSWNTRLSRTSVSSLSCARFSAQESLSSHGLEDVIRTLQTLSLPHYRLGELVREERLGQGETYIVERCVDQKGSVLAVKHLKVSSEVDETAFRQRLRSVILEIKIMRHGPLRAHPNILDVRGYGWNTPRGLIVPYILVDFAPMGTMREHISKVKPALSHVEILVGDIASGLSMLHSCGIIHGDMKLDNVLVFPSWDRPAKAIAKIADFGHAVILNEKRRGEGNPSIEYRGTSMYNAPEVHTQNEYPIDQQDLIRCDIWAFGLLIWESCIEGDEYLGYLTKNNLIVTCDDDNQNGINWEYLLGYAKSAVKGRSIGSPMFLRAALHMTLQVVFTKRATDMRSIPLCTQWNSKSLLDLQTDMALHLESPTPTYEMFRLDNGREIAWQHQQQIFQGLKQTHSKRLAKDIGPVIWQIALCYHLGFGTSASQEEAFQYGEMAASEGHVIAEAFGCLLDPKSDPSQEDQEPYVSRILRLLQSDPGLSEGMPSLVKECFQGDYQAICDILTQGASIHLSTIDGCTLYHWMFLFQDEELIQDISQTLSSRSNSTSNPVNYPCTMIRHVHSQWPLEFLGTPLAVAISVNSLVTVKTLLKLGADPFLPVYHDRQFPDVDPRSHWTAFHVAAKYHCGDILLYLVNHTSQERQQCLTPLACALGFSSILERLAMHRSRHRKQLRLTIATIQKVQTLEIATDTGMTALMQAIDFQDADVVSELLHADPRLAQLPFYQPVNEKVFNLPIHFAAQIAARSDALEALLIPKLISDHANFLDRRDPVPRDSMGRTPLHLAATGSSNKVSDWIVHNRKGLLHVEDNVGRVPLHYCASVSNCELLLSQGVTINHADKHGMTALHLACYGGSTELVRCLLSGNPDLTLNNNLYGTPLHCSVFNGSVDTVVCLLEAGAIVNGIDQGGNTATHVAARLGRHSILRILMQYGADVEIHNLNKRNAKMIAAGTGNIGILRILDHGWETKVNQGILNLNPGERAIGHLLQGVRSDWSGVPDFAWEHAVEKAATNPSANIQSNSDDTVETKSADNSETHLNQDQTFIFLEHFLARWLPDLLSCYPEMLRIKKLTSLCYNTRLWQPVYAPRLIDFWTRIVLVITEGLQNHKSPGVTEDLHRLATSTLIDEPIHDLDVDISGHKKAALWIATELVARSIISAKPYEMYPGRVIADFKDMIYSEILMDHLKSRSEDKLLDVFPELDFSQWCTAEEKSQATSSSSTGLRDIDYQALRKALQGSDDYDVRKALHESDEESRIAFQRRLEEFQKSTARGFITYTIGFYGETEQLFLQRPSA